MIFDGLSVLQKPFYRGELTGAVGALIIGDVDRDDFLLVEGGNYLAGVSGTEGSRHIALYHRLNPDQPDGRFHGSLDDLAFKQA